MGLPRLALTCLAPIWMLCRSRRKRLCLSVLRAMQCSRICIFSARSGYTTRIPFIASKEIKAQAKDVFF